MDPRPEKLTAVAKTHGIVVLLRFGSWVTGKLHARSDVNLAVLVERVPACLGGHGRPLQDPQALFPEREADVPFVNRAAPLFLKKIADSCKLLYGLGRRLQELKTYAFNRYQDQREYLDLEREDVERSLEEL